uniref:Uncharacterized protein n=1 Tax=Sus scrofa TaxID=9823 RepID=A0A8W4FB54_PIG
MKHNKSKVCVTQFIVIFALLWWSVTKPSISLMYACTFMNFLHSVLYCNAYLRKYTIKNTIPKSTIFLIWYFCS